MIDESNPYASPLAEEPVDNAAYDIGARESVWTEDGKHVYALKGVNFPDRCVKCNESAGGYVLRKNYSWHPSWVFILVFLLGPLPYIIVAAIMSKKSAFGVGLCLQHRSKRKKYIVAAWLIAVVSIGMMFACTLDIKKYALLFVLGLVTLLVAIIVGIVGTRVLVPRYMDDRMAKLKGACPAFLLSLTQ